MPDGGHSRPSIISIFRQFSFWHADKCDEMPSREYRIFNTPQVQRPFPVSQVSALISAALLVSAI